MALVISLIMLSVTLVMAVAFLALSRRERAAVTTTTDTATARLAAESARAAAEAQIAANIWTTNTAAGNFGLLVSTNYQNYDFGYTLNSANPTNVFYNYPNGNLLAGGDLIQNIANLWFLPRVPVFIRDRNTGLNDFRYYLDLNRNGRFETNGYIAEFDNAGNYLTNGVHTGDPEWIGVLERPDQPHGPNNKFVSRYAFLAQPIGNSLDLNHVHNYAKRLGGDSFYRNQGVGSWEINLGAFLADLNTNQWGYNYALVAATGLPDLNVANSGKAFEDARSLLLWRYGGNYNNLATANNYFANAATVLPYDNIDNYGDGPIQSGIPGVDETIPANRDNSSLSWAGADNPNRFFALTSDLFDPVKTASSGVDSFTNRLMTAGTNYSTYDRYTFYRMLNQLGTDSSADADKLNLNYSNAVVQYNSQGVVTSIGIIPGAETNMMPWKAQDFFHAAANRLLRQYTAAWATPPTNTLSVNPDFTNTFGTVVTSAFGVTNIPVYVEGRFVYTPAVHRLLQLAANLYDATANRSSLLGKDFPHVFKPIFSVVANGTYKDLYITGYKEIETVATADLNQPALVSEVVAANPAGTVVNDVVNVYDVPWIIGAKKGFPNFNQFQNRSTVRVTRKLQLERNNPLQPGGTPSNLTFTNQMFIMSISNRFGVAFWNSYTTNYTPQGSLIVYADNRFDLSLTNNQGLVYNALDQHFYYNPTKVSLALWRGSAWNTYSGQKSPLNQEPDPASFLWSALDYGFLPESQYSVNGVTFRPINNTVWERGSPSVPVFPQFGLLTTNRLQAYIVDGNRVIDYVHFSSSGFRDIDAEIQDRNDNAKERQQMRDGTSMWNTNGYLGAAVPTEGVVNQIYVSRFTGTGSGDKVAPGDTVADFWKNPANMPPGVNTSELEADFFNAFFVGGGVFNNKEVFYENTNRLQQAPYTPTRTAWDLDLWQANDPLVHHLAGDMITTSSLTVPDHADVLGDADYPDNSDLPLDALTSRYQPWGLGKQMDYFDNVVKDAYDSRIRDPLVWRSDYWDFPANKLPSVGWLGRVHRGTPWQTVYLKSRNLLTQLDVGTNTWAKWTGNNARSFGVNNYWDAANTAPVRDGMLFDLFTARLNENAAHGTLSVNVGAGQGADGGLAAWSAVFSGLVALTNTTPVPGSSKIPAYTNLIVSPAGVAGVNSAVGMIVTNINGIRSGYRTAGGLTGTFTSVGDILRVPVLTEKSPFLNWNNTDQQKFGISDQLYEWLPQQIVGLLRVNPTPRYVVYCLGQALRPASESFVTDSGANFGLCTNYQVVAESAARAVVRVERNIVRDAGGNPVSTNYTTTVESYNPLPPD